MAARARVEFQATTKDPRGLSTLCVDASTQRCFVGAGGAIIELPGVRLYICCAPQFFFAKALLTSYDLSLFFSTQFFKAETLPVDTRIGRILFVLVVDPSVVIAVYENKKIYEFNVKVRACKVFLFVFHASLYLCLSAARTNATDVFGKAGLYDGSGCNVCLCIQDWRRVWIRCW